MEYTEKTIVLVIAMIEEAQGILENLAPCEILWKSDEPDRPHQLYRKQMQGFKLLILLSGILEHNAMSLLTRTLVEVGKIDLVINFGCVGANCKGKMSIGDWAFVKEVRHYDVGDIVPSSMYVPLKLAVPKNRPSVICTTGARFTRGQPGCDCEDMELYGLASLCHTNGITIMSLKYTANFCDENAESDFAVNVVKARGNAQSELISFIKGIDSSLLNQLSSKSNPDWLSRQN